MIIAASRDVPRRAVLLDRQAIYLPSTEDDGLPDSRILWIGPGYKFELLDPFQNEDADIEPGFIFNAASIPRIFWSIPGLSPVDLGTYSVLVHDWKYHLGEGPRMEAERIFLDYMKREKIGPWPRYPAYAGTVAFGEHRWGGSEK